MNKEIEELKEKLSKMEPDTIGYALMEIEIRERELLEESLKRLL